jgi:hypothetical protein
MLNSNSSGTKFTQPRLPLPPAILGSEEGSFAYYTVTGRMPAIARRVIAENKFPPIIIEKLETLATELSDGKVRPLKDDGGEDVESWSKYVEPFAGMRWLDVPWFFAETYFYRSILEATNYFQPGDWQGVDPFGYQKRLGLHASMDAIPALTNFRIEGDADESRNDFIKLLYFDLWGNRADLSLWPAGESDRSNDPLPEQTNILVDLSSQIADKVASFDKVRIDIVADNAGFELVCDLCLADFLLTNNAAGTVYLHLKSHPTFVSDATIKDVHYTLEILEANKNKEVLRSALRLQDYIARDRLRLQDDLFWTSPLAFWEMPESLQQDLSLSSLILVKGDANYRRILGDRHWPFTTPFEDIACYFPSPMAALRTLKSELAAGLHPSQIEALNQQDPNWLTNGERGVIQFVI